MQDQQLTISFYLGQGTDSQARIILRQLPKSQRTWIVAFGRPADEWQTLIAECWEGLATRPSLRAFSPRLIYPEQFEKPWLDERACDVLLIDGLSMATNERLWTQQGLADLFAIASLRRMSMHLFVWLDDEEQIERIEQILCSAWGDVEPLRFWLANQQRDMRYIRFPTQVLGVLPHAGSQPPRLSQLLQERWQGSPQHLSRLADSETGIPGTSRCSQPTLEHDTPYATLMRSEESL